MNRIGKLTKTACFCVHLFSTPIFAEEDHLKSEDFLNAMAAYESGDYEAARRSLLPLAEQGHAQAQHTVGLMHEYGMSFAIDYNEAMYWYRLSAEQGFAPAQVEIGRMSEWYMKQDGEMLKWFGKAAEQGDLRGQIFLAKAYGERREYEKSLLWSRIAAEQGHPKAHEMLGEMYENGRGVERSNLYAYMWYVVGLHNGGNIQNIYRLMHYNPLSSSEEERATLLAKECILKGYIECEK